MCGITGVFDYARRRDVSAEVVERMTTALTHRGPDDSGIWRGRGVAIAMRRLSIVDVGGGHQPIANEAGDCWIVFNGEIYNHRALRAELETKGHRFRTGSDTEAVLHLYEEDGVDGIRRLDGMFAFAIVDLRRGEDRPRAVFARDRFGKKPLFYADHHGQLVFGSELKAILAHGGVPRELDREALHHYLSLHFVPEPLSIFRAIRKLPSAHVMVCDEAGVSIRPYWDVREVVRDEPTSPVDGPRRVRELLFAAVQKRLDLEVPFGAFLSGGLDSGAVVAVMGQVLDRPVKTYSIGFEGPATHDELPAARLSAKHFRTDHHELMARPDLVALVHDLVEFADEPLAISSCLPLLLLAREARREVKVVLTGDGGDEIFGGYPQYQYERWATIWRHLPRGVDGAVLALTRAARRLRLGERARPLGHRVARFIANSRRGPGARRLGWATGFSEEEKQALYGPELRDRGGGDTPALLEARLVGFEQASPARQANLLDLLVWLPDEMLAKVDRMTMAASLEARSPLLDYDLVAHVERSSFDARIPGDPRARSKALLREAVADLLPPHLLDGRKQGFNVPFDAWFRGDAAPFLEHLLSRERVAARGLFDPDAVAGWVAAHRRGEVNAMNRLFTLVVFEAWAERYL